MPTMSKNANGDYTVDLTYPQTLTLNTPVGYLFTGDIIVRKILPKAKNFTNVTSSNNGWAFTIGTGGFVRTSGSSYSGTAINFSSYWATSTNGGSSGNYTEDSNNYYIIETWKTKNTLSSKATMQSGWSNQDTALSANFSSSGMTFTDNGYVHHGSLALQCSYYSSIKHTQNIGYDSTSSENNHTYQVLNSGKNAESLTNGINLYVNSPSSGNSNTYVYYPDTFRVRYYTSTHTVYRYNMPSLTYYDRYLYFYVNGSQVASKSASSSSGYPSAFSFDIYSYGRISGTNVVYVKKV